MLHGIRIEDDGAFFSDREFQVSDTPSIHAAFDDVTLLIFA